MTLTERLMSSANLLRLGIPEDYHDAAYSSFVGRSSHPVMRAETTPENIRQAYACIVKKVDDYLDAGIQRLGLYVSGPNGSGKSYLLSALLLDKIRAGIFSRRVTMLGFTESYTRNSWRIPAEYLSADVLFIDELGKEPSYSNRLSETLAEALLKYRDERRKITWISTNASIDDIVARYGESVRSIILGRMVALPFPNFDIRRVQRKMLSGKAGVA